MKKQLLLLAVGGFLLGACSSEDTPAMKGDEGRIIAFTDGYVDNAVSRTATTTANLDYFQVWAFVDVPGSRVFDGAVVTKDTAGVWSVNETRYWFPDHKYYFTGIGPEMTSSEFKYTPLITWHGTPGNYPGGGAIMFLPTSNDYQTDMVYSFVANPTINEPVPMTFQHILSQVNVAFENDVSAPMQLWIQNVQISGLATQGTLKTYESPMVWENTGTLSTPIDLAIPKDPNAYRYVKYGEQDVSRYMYMLPGTTDCTITFDVTPYTDGITQMGGPYKHTVTVQNASLEMGKSYTILVKINATNLTADLKPITFTVNEVEEWGDSSTINGGFSTPTD